MDMQRPLQITTWTLLLVISLTGCAGVKVSPVSSTDYMAQRRGDVLSAGRLSVYTAAALHVVGLDRKSCERDGASCRSALEETIGLDRERRLSALAELWLQEALALDKSPRDRNSMDAILNAYLETARYAYAYLFLTERTPAMRALEDRQTQVRDYYNFAVQQTLVALFEYVRDHPVTPVGGRRNAYLHSGAWRISIKTDQMRLADERDLPDELIPASSLSFAGLRNQYRRDGLGAELVAATSGNVVSLGSATVSYSETPFPALTAFMRFPGNTLEEILRTHEAIVIGYDPYRPREH